MFERFSQDAREALIRSADEARLLRRDYIGPEHLLLSLAAQRTGVAAGALAGIGLDITDLRERLGAEAGATLDAAALASLGIDLESVRASAEAAFGPGALDRPSSSLRGRFRLGGSPLNERAKKSIELALRAAVGHKHNYICTGHLLLGVLDKDNQTVLRLLAGAGADVDTLRGEVRRRLAEAA
ncbi:MAG TPA: Clp protease N-terminal domain-containing protein [Streptosporangiaceae bacterium]|nr:Clp protease N-terminal domain-containing protein [Streptosporangiaceae bacterium]